MIIKYVENRLFSKNTSPSRRLRIEMMNIDETRTIFSLLAPLHIGTGNVEALRRVLGYSAKIVYLFLFRKLS